MMISFNVVILALVFGLGFCVGAVVGIIKGRAIYRMTWEEIQRYQVKQ